MYLTVYNNFTEIHGTRVLVIVVISVDGHVLSLHVTGSGCYI